MEAGLMKEFFVN